MAGATRKARKLSPICDSNPERLKIVSDQFAHCAPLRGRADMFAAGGFDFVDIATTVKSHLPLVTMAAAQACRPSARSPLRSDIADAKAMVEACRAAGVPLMVHENFRFQSPIEAVKAMS